MVRRPAGGGTEVAWASSQGRSGGMQRAGGRVLRQVRKSAGGGAPVRSWWKPCAANACVVVTELMGDKLFESLQAKASLGDHRAGSGYAFGCRNPLGGAVVGTSPPFLASSL
uniref:Uncharacterized protein n=1 Tax=Oryza glumipatula TaxID=40148 RepID=A0A0E0BVF2_9ORYZ